MFFRIPGRRSIKNIFISHTKSEAAIALLVRQWIETRFSGNVETFVSESDISGGSQWLSVVEKALRRSGLVIVMCSPRSIRKAWVQFEAGGAWGRDVPLLPVCHSGLSVSDLPSPLSAFQGISITAPDFATRLARSVSECFAIQPSVPVDDADLVARIEDTVAAAHVASDRFNVFVSAPMSSLGAEGYEAFRRNMDPVLQALAGSSALNRYYFAGNAFGDVAQFDDQLVGTKRDLSALASSDRFLMIYPERLVSSTLVEAGFALALGIPSVIFVRQREDLPYSLEEIGQLSQTTSVLKFRSLEEIGNRIRSHGSELWSRSWGNSYA
jgi:hypothetical protein